ncbi:hypothetical protein [Streptomyces sp. 11-1-2]|uniref:hypothetical protein n=1 Tax=unclassified Streptomyces TaxID=2593676 RepID=UPI001968DD71|nr:hypothetical protein [Streptomyces sp. 11-1-2]
MLADRPENHRRHPGPRRQRGIDLHGVRPAGPRRRTGSRREADLGKHNVTEVRLDDINENLEALGRGDIVGRQVIVFEGTA